MYFFIANVHLKLSNTDVVLFLSRGIGKVAIT